MCVCVCVCVCAWINPALTFRVDWPEGLSTLADWWSLRTPDGEEALMKMTKGWKVEVRSSLRACRNKSEDEEDRGRGSVGKGGKRRE